jgi:hypothetical protein
LQKHGQIERSCIILQNHPPKKKHKILAPRPITTDPTLLASIAPHADAS